MIKNKKYLRFSDVDDEKVRLELLGYLQLSAIKHNAFLPPITLASNNPPIYGDIYFAGNQKQSLPNTWSRFTVDVKEILGYDRPISLTALLLLKKIKAENPQPQIILCMETTGFTLAGAILALHDIFFPKDKLEACYIRKGRKIVDLGRLMEGSRVFSGKRAVFVDDFLNKGRSFFNVSRIAQENNINLQKGFFVVQNDHVRIDLSRRPKIPCDSIFTINQIMNTKMIVDKKILKYSFEHNRTRMKPRVEKETKDPLWRIDLLGDANNRLLSREDIELVKLAKDSAAISVASEYKNSPYLKYDGRGSFGYLPFMGKYLQQKGSALVKISKREFKNGCWINRARGAAFSGFNNDVIAQNVVKATVDACKKSPRLMIPHQRGPFHKAIWSGELGSLSFFIFIVEEAKLVDSTELSTALKNGIKDDAVLLVKKDGYHRIFLGNMKKTFESAKVSDFLLSNLFNGEELKNFKWQDDPEIYNLKGKWLWLPERPKKYFFNHID